MIPADIDNLFHERHLWDQGYRHIAGVDEAGRGPLAGPVVAAAVMLPFQLTHLKITDSKLLSDQKRREMNDWIVERADAVGVGVVWQHEIDQVNILNATMKAMMLAVEDLSKTPEYILVDGDRSPEFHFPSMPIIGGDQRSVCISSASIIAKVTRDDIMMEYDKIYPQYGFGKHKGYPTADHFAAIHLHGPCPLHRFSFNLDKK